jgi:hypothetical protein
LLWAISASQYREYLSRTLQAAIGLTALPAAFAQPKVARPAGDPSPHRLNSYSFDKPLREGSMTPPMCPPLCPAGIEALDATGYYLLHPKVPADDYIYNLGQ